MTTFLTILHVLVCIFLIGVVLLQRGKGVAAIRCPRVAVCLLRPGGLAAAADDGRCGQRAAGGSAAG